MFFGYPRLVLLSRVTRQRLPATPVHGAAGKQFSRARRGDNNPSRLPRWCALGGLLVGHLLGCSTAQAQQVLTDVNECLALRLETTCRYQQAALLPLGISGNYYLALGQGKWLVETRTSGPQFVREVYQLGSTARDTSSRSKARYSQGNSVSRVGQLVSVGVFHSYTSYPTLTTIDAGQLLVRQQFNPQDLLQLQFGTARSGQRVWIQSTAPGLLGDTLACYELTQRPAWWELTLVERRVNGKRQWRHNTVRTYEWTLDPVNQRIFARQAGDPDNGYATLWERQYSTRTDFTETCTAIHPIETLAEGTGRVVLYERTFQQLSSTRSLDRYTVPRQQDLAAHSFSIVGLYEGAGTR